MVPVKIECGCGQRYAFDVEPVNGRMPSPIKCPACGMDGTAAANESIAYMLSLHPKAAVAPAPTTVAIAAAPPIPAAAPASAPRSFSPATLAAPPVAPTVAPASYAPQALPTTTSTSDSKGWKWWYYIAAGILIGLIDGIAIYQTGNLRYIKGLLLSVLLIAIGIWDFNAKRGKK